jgi:hypothetical protein
MNERAPGFSFFPIVMMWVSLAALPVIAWLVASLLYEGLGLDWSRHLDGDLILVTVGLVLLYAGYVPIAIVATKSLGSRPLVRAPLWVGVVALAVPGLAAFAYYYVRGGIDDPEFNGALGFIALAIYGLGAVLAIILYVFPIGRER